MLRKELFRRLSQQFHGASIANENEEMKAFYRGKGDRKELEVVDGGEYYRVNCPHCNDTRRRLWVNYKWGLYDSLTKSKNLFLCVCYNENCLSKPGRVKQLYDIVFSDFYNEQNDIVQTGIIKESVDIKAEIPGTVIPVNKLNNSHPAYRYLKEERGFDLDYLYNNFFVSYCTQPLDKFPVVRDRLIIPVYNNSELKGWQARIVGKSVSKTIPKYYTMPGMKRNRLLYNIDVARKYDYVVIMEGPSDVWRFGPEAVCLFGKTISSIQLGMVLAIWKKVYIVLDGDAPEAGQAICDAIGNKVECKLIELPKHLDPGDIPTPALRSKVLS